MIRLFFRVVWGKITQAMTDAKGMLLRPRATMEEISERKDWGIPLALLGLVLFTGLPYLFTADFTKIDIGSRNWEWGVVLLPGFLSVPIYVAIVVFWMRLAGGNWRLGAFLRLLGYSAIPFLLLYLSTALVVITVIGLHVLPFSGQHNPAVPVLMFAILVASFAAWTVWITFLMLRTIYRSATGGHCILCLITAILVTNIANSALFGSALLKGDKASLFRAETSGTVTTTNYPTNWPKTKQGQAQDGQDAQPK
jgi:hypothetical protein